MQDSPSACPLVVGIDVGGTKTHLRALACDTPVAGRRRPPGGRTPVRRAVGGHACETPRQCERIRTALPLCFDAPALVVGDAHLLAPAAGLDKGTALVAGTGSVAVGRLPDGTAVQVGG
ncbi:hypothetical protein [Streptomyces canus]|uniref:hypothetical protein n=2 Tax=Streptomyces TaxID=1883 RepID=UPI003CE71432